MHKPAPLGLTFSLLTSVALAASCGDDPASAPPDLCADATSAAFVRPFAVDAQAYPFRSCAFETGHGRMHFFDEGPRDAEETILMVHGNPTWSYSYRHIASAMIARGHRVIAVDHLGMGMSDAPDPGEFDYRPRSQSTNLEALVLAMELKDVTLVVQDWGGPIGLGVATRHPALFRRLLLLNTWGSLATTLYASDPLFGCTLMLTLTAESLAKLVDPSEGAEYAKIVDAYLRPAIDPATRKPFADKECAAMSTMAISILGDNAFQAEVGGGLEKLRGKPYALFSGLQDQLFGALGCDPAADSLCPGAAVCECDPDYDASNNACGLSPLGDERVCKLDGAVIEQNLDQWVERLGSGALVTRVGDPRSEHMVQELAPDGVIDALDRLLATPAD